MQSKMYCDSLFIESDSQHPAADPHPPFLISPVTQHKSEMEVNYDYNQFAGLLPVVHTR